MKSRVIIWSVVGIFVIAGVVFVLSKPKTPGAARLTPERLNNAVSQTEVQVNRLSGRLVAARSAGQPLAQPAKADEADRLLTEAREKLAQLKQVTDLKQGEAQLRAVKKAVREARRALELALGTVARPQSL